MANHYKNIVVAVDGSKEAEYAFRKSIDVAKRNVGCTLNLVNVIDTRSFAAIEAYDRSIAERAQQHAENLLDGYKKQAEEEVKATTQTVVPELSSDVASDLALFTGNF